MSATPRIETVLFDAAGTLIELRESVGTSYARVAREHGVELPAWRLDDAFSRIFPQAPPLLFPEATGAEIDACERQWWRAVVRSTFLATDSTARFEDFDGFFDALYTEFSRPESWCPRQGCHAMLAELRGRGMTLGVVSNFDRRLYALFAGLELASLVDAIILPSDAGAEKPAAEIFEFALSQLGATASATVFVGDSDADDIRGARALGMRTIDVTSLANFDDFPDRLGKLAAHGAESTDD
ncbi:MAG: HAD-IA family hydrolase [Deltaproteobacteria bacterium]|nr:HAD-IA family hydrolase [Deltaproteobacteria bacterium]MBW2398275.1 HAD-IA family hydrolase [Deltaproteobacteria bacterium]MBW2668139.1 HAD-IA family hydrolase [Deltaproteobacteria bacterium]